MKWFACLVVASLGCQSGAGDAPASGQSVRAAPPGSGYAKDIEALCESVVRSGADKIEPEARTLTNPNWLAANLTTPESRQFLVRIQPLVGDAKASALDGEAKRVGLTGCSLATEWRSPPTP